MCRQKARHAGCEAAQAPQGFRHTRQRGGGQHLGLPLATLSAAEYPSLRQELG